MLNIDRYAYSSKLRHKNPQSKLAFALFTLVVCIWADSIPVSLIILSMMAWVTVRKGGTPFLLFLKLMFIPMSFLALGILTVAFAVSESDAGFLWHVPAFGRYCGISETGIVTAAVLFFKALGAVSCLYYLSLSTPMADLLYAFRKMRCPKLAAELMGLIYRFIFILLETAETMATAQTARMGYDRLSNGFRSLGMLVSALFVRSLRRADAIYTALEARGYDGEINVLEERFEISFSEKIQPVIINLFLIMLTLLLRHYGGIVQ